MSSTLIRNSDIHGKTPMQSFILTCLAGVVAGIILLFVEYRYFKRGDQLHRETGPSVAPKKVGNSLFHEFPLARPQARTHYSINNSLSNQLGETIRQAYRETKDSNFHLGFRLFYFHLAASFVIATLVTLDWWNKDWLLASPTGPFVALGLACDISDLDDWISKNKPVSVLRSWRLSFWLLCIAFALASALILVFHAGSWLESFFLSQVMGVGTILVITVGYYILRLFRLTD
jgi:hypothetical protein